jgi:hypothetical protein
MPRRILLIGGVLTAAIVLVTSLAIWGALSLWLPTEGKARLIGMVEGRTPTDLSIGTVRYRPLQGIVLTDVRVVGRDTQELWGVAPMIRVQVGWLTLALSRRLVFRADAVLEWPVQTTLTLSGRYHLRDQSLSLDGRTTDLPLRTLTAPLTRHVPAPLNDGTLRVQLHLRRSPPGPAAITGRIEGSRVTWETPSWSLRGDVALEGTAIPPLLAGDRWMVEGDVTLRRATLEGLATIGTIEHLEGRAHVGPERAEIREVNGTALGSRWTLDGIVTMPPHASVEARLTSRATLAPLTAALPALTGTWQPKGLADLQAVCRGPLQPTVSLDCLASADIHEAALAGSKLTYPLTHMTGRLRYDLLARRLAIDHLTARLQGEPLTLSGDVELWQPWWLGVHVSGVVPLEMARPWLPPANSPVSGLGGVAAFDLAISGPSTALSYTGELVLRDGMATLAKPAITLERAVASVRFSPHRIEVTDATLTANGQPVTLSAAIEPAEIPRLAATIGFPRGRLWFDSRVTPADVLIDDGRLTLNASQLEIRGRIARRDDHLSAVDVSGAIELAEMSRLPWLPLPALETWRLEGVSAVEGQFRGRFSDWPAAGIQGRLRADRLRVRDIPVEQVTITLEQRDGVLRVRVPSSLIAQGKTWGELTIEHRRQAPPGTALLQADVTGLQLSTLAQAIPAWRSRSLTGTASARALVSGAWGAPSTWRGEGWLNASGERLADLPLLDKVFRGLFGVLGDRLGLESLRRAQITQASLRWRLAEERVHTDDLRLAGMAGTEPVAIYAKGSVGLDRTLDFVIEPELSEGVMVQAPTTSTLASAILRAAGGLERLRRLIGRHRLTGTVDDPDYRFELTTQEIFKQLAPGPGDLLQQLFNAVD